MRKKGFASPLDEVDCPVRKGDISFSQLLESLWYRINFFIEKLINDSEIAHDLAIQTFRENYVTKFNRDLWSNIKSNLYDTAGMLVMKHRYGPELAQKMFDEKREELIWCETHVEIVHRLYENSMRDRITERLVKLEQESQQ